MREAGNRLWTNRRWLPTALPLFYLVVLFGGASLKTDYSHISQYISELNAMGSAWSWQIGYFGFLPLGLLGFVLLLAVAPSTGLTGVSRVGCWLLVAEPVVYVASAIFPCDIGCPVEGSLSQNIHNFVSAITLPITTLGLVLLFFNKGIAPVRRLGWLTLAGVFITLYSLALVPDFAEWRGLLQRLAEGILYGCLWLVSWQLLSAQNDLTAENG